MKVLNRENAIKILSEKYVNSKFTYPEDVVDSWSVFVRDIVSGKYNGNENEYWNDLDTREIIETIGYGHSEEVKTIDDDFRKILIHTDVRNWRHNNSNIDDWWNFGYPKTLRGYLKNYFKSDFKFRKK
jgi:hypothetical protein